MRQKDFFGLRLAIFYALAIALAPATAKAGGPQATQVRIFGGAQAISPTAVNDEIKARGLDEYKNINGFGMEVGYSLLPRVNFGVRIISKYQQVKEAAAVSANILNPYYSSLQQTEGLGVVRISLVDSRFFILDAFGGAGVSSMKLDVRTSLGEGSYEQSNYALATTAGVTAGVGWSNVYLFGEVGQEWVTFDNFTRSGTTSTSIDKVDGSGTFVMIGLAFKGVPGFVHLNGSSGKK